MGGRGPGGTNGAQEARTRPRRYARTGGRADWAVGGGRAAVGWIGRTGRREVRWSSGWADWGGWADGRTGADGWTSSPPVGRSGGLGGRAGGPRRSGGRAGR